jgi:hypothetical protein
MVEEPFSLNAAPKSFHGFEKYLLHEGDADASKLRLRNTDPVLSVDTLKQVPFSGRKARPQFLRPPQ